jgi:hypothetical protein
MRERQRRQLGLGFGLRLGPGFVKQSGFGLRPLRLGIRLGLQSSRVGSETENRFI